MPWFSMFWKSDLQYYCFNSCSRSNSAIRSHFRVEKRSFMMQRREVRWWPELDTVEIGANSFGQYVSIAFICTFASLASRYSKISLISKGFTGFPRSPVVISKLQKIVWCAKAVWCKVLLDLLDWCEVWCAWCCGGCKRSPRILVMGKK